MYHKVAFPTVPTIPSSTLMPITSKPNDAYKPVLMFISVTSPTATVSAPLVARAPPISETTAPNYALLSVPLPTRPQVGLIPTGTKQRIGVSSNVLRDGSHKLKSVADVCKYAWMALGAIKSQEFAYRIRSLTVQQAPGPITSQIYAKATVQQIHPTVRSSTART